MAIITEQSPFGMETLLGTDQQIIVFLDAISMALQRIEPHFQAIGAVEETPEEIMEETEEENMSLLEEHNEISIDHTILL
uniref:Uncharacterized protein n=1 Tax=Globodera rostochiensis TaxID=31243 RepID=A0A914HMA8_GLORO